MCAQEYWERREVKWGGGEMGIEVHKDAGCNSASCILVMGRV
jgi:hypothetical protein